MQDKKLDWKEKEDYAYLEKENRLEAWAWEFLRRIPEYRAEFSEFLKQEENGWLYYDPPRKKGEPEEVWKYRCEVDYGVSGREISLSQYTASKWLLKDMYAPAMMYDQGVAFVKPSDVTPHVITKQADCRPYFKTVEVVDGNDGTEEPQVVDDLEMPDDCYVLAAFDLTRSFEMQIKQLQKVFNARKKGLSRRNSINPEPERWIKYLRALDADAESKRPTNIEIIKTIDGKCFGEGENYNYSQSGNDLIDAAKAQQNLYRNLLYGFHKNKPE